MASSASILSRTLQSITVTKIKELEKQRHAYEKSKSEALDEAQGEAKDVRKRVSRLHDRVTKLDVWSPDELRNMRGWIDQAEYDPSIGDAALSQFEAVLKSRLDMESKKLGLADLYSRLLTEWIDSPNTEETEAAMLESTSLDDPFEMVQTRQKERLQQLRDKFERVVFEPLETDESGIDHYLDSLFVGDSGKKVLEKLRDDVSKTGERMLSEKRLLDDRSLKWSIKALLKNQLLNDEKKASLQEFLRDEAVLTEIRDVLNMRYRDLQNWSWNIGTAGMPVVPRQSLNGKWRVMMDEDVLEAIFTQWIGIMWAVQLKGTLRNIEGYTGIWKHATNMPYEEVQKRKYYGMPLKGDYPNRSVDSERLTTYWEHFFMAPLPSRIFEAGGYDDDDETGYETDSKRKSPKEIKQLLLRTLATEVVLRRSLDGAVAVVQSDFQWFATGLAHSTVFAVLRFMGFQEEWIRFLKKVLEPPLDMLNDKPVRTRKRGLPMAHIFEKLFGELVLFMMDVAVNQEASMLLYRFHDDLWLVGEPQNCAKAWRTMKEFAEIMGLEFNEHKTGSVYLVEKGIKKDASIVKALPEGQVVMNFLILDPDSGRWIINKEHVQQHVEQLQKQLAGTKSVLEWIKTWNSCIGRFFSYTFGDPALCFGRYHLDQVLATHKEMQEFLFKSHNEGVAATVTNHLKGLISRRFGVTDVPDAFLYLSESFGGLNLQNPFTSLFLVRESISIDPDEYMKKFHLEEKLGYDEAKKLFDTRSEHQRSKTYRDCFKKDNYVVSSGTELSWEDAQKFPSFAEYTKWRESSSALLEEIYTSFMAPPSKREPNVSNTVEQALMRLRASPDMGEEMELGEMSAEMRWTIQYHANELFEKFGGLAMVDKSLLPLSVLQAMQSRRVTWQMVL